MEARFAAAARHSRMVRVLRVAVPAAVVLAMAAIVAVSIFNPFRMLLPKLPVDMGNLVVSGTKITMESPHLSGFSHRSAALRSLGQDRDPGSDRSRSRRTQDAARQGADGRQDHGDAGCPHRLCSTPSSRLLDLRKDIFLQTSTGYEARLTQAYVDMNKGTVTSDEHVDVKLLNGTLTADKLRIIERRRGGAVRRQCRDEPGSWTVRRASRAEPRAAPPPPAKTRSVSGKSANAK